MAVAAVRDQTLRLCYSVIKAYGSVHCEHGAEFFVSEFLADIHGLDLADEYLGGFRHRHARQLGDGNGLLTDDLRVQRAVDDDSLAHLVDLVVLQEVAAARGKFSLYRVVNALVHNNALLRRADHAVVECLGMDDRVDREQDIGALVDDGGGVACANAQSGLAAGIRRLYHSGAAGGKYAVSLLHQHVGELKRGNVNPTDDTLGSARLDSRFQNQLRRGDCALLGTGMGADDDPVAGLKAQQRLKDRGGGGVGRGDNSGDNADGLGDLYRAEHLVFLNNAAGLNILVGVVDVLRGKVVLYHLVLNNAHACFLDRHFSERDPRAARCCRGGKEDLVHLLLREGRKRLLRFSYCAQRRSKALGVVHDGIFFVAHKIYLFILPLCAESLFSLHFNKLVVVCLGEGNSVGAGVRLDGELGRAVLKSGVRDLGDVERDGDLAQVEALEEHLFVDA